MNKKPVRQALREHIPEIAPLMQDAHKSGIRWSAIVIAHGPGDEPGGQDIDGVIHRTDAPLVTQNDCIAWWKK